MSLADQIINHEPWNPDAPAGIQATGEELNALRDELLEGRRLRTADERRKRYEARGAASAELLRRADQHGEECRD